MQTVKVHTSQNIEIDYEVANLGDRLLAWFIDMGVMVGVFNIFYFIIIFLFASTFATLGSGGMPTIIIVMMVVFSILGTFYNLVCEIFFNGQSIGKHAMKIKVISLDGSRPGVGQFLLRWVFRLIDIGITSGVCAIISIAVSKNKQRLGDLVAGTTIIKTKPRAQLQDLYFTPTEEDYQPVLPAANNLTDEEVTLIYEVISAFKRSGNSQLVFDMAQKVKNHLGIELPQGMNEYDFLQTVVKDYNHQVSRMEM